MPLAPGSTGQVNAASGAAAAVASRLMPPGGPVSWHASPPPAGSSQSARFPAVPSARAAPGSLVAGWPLPGWPLAGAPPPGGPSGGAGRADRNSSEPSGRKAGLSSPSADRVSRAARPPNPTYVGLAGSPGWAGPGPAGIRQILGLKVRPSALSADTLAASQLPSGDSRNPVSRGSAM